MCSSPADRDRIAAVLGDHFPEFDRIEEHLTSLSDGDAARALAADYVERHDGDGEKAFDDLDPLVDDFDQGADELDHDETRDEWTRIERARGVALEATAYVEEATLRWAEGGNEDMRIATTPPPGWRPSELRRALVKVKRAENQRSDLSPPPRASTPRSRERRERRHIARSTSSADPGEDDPEPAPPQASPWLVCSLCDTAGRLIEIGPAHVLCTVCWCECLIGTGT